jgi:hypothetical protein
MTSVGTALRHGRAKRKKGSRRFGAVSSKAERSIMDWTKVTKSLSRDCSGNDDAAVLSRRDVLAGIGFAGVIAVAGSTLLASSPAEGRTIAPAIEPEAAPADAAKAEVAESNVAKQNLADFDAADFTEFSAQWRRRYWRRRYWRRRYWGRRYWRRRYWRRRHWRRRQWRRRYWRRRYWRRVWW